MKNSEYKVVYTVYKGKKRIEETRRNNDKMLTVYVSNYYDALPVLWTLFLYNEQ